MADQCPSSSHISGPPESPWNKPNQSQHGLKTSQLYPSSMDDGTPVELRLYRCCGSQSESRWTPTWQLSTPPSGYPAHNMLEVILYCGNKRWHWSWGNRGTSASWRTSGRFSARHTDILIDKFVKMFVSQIACLCLTVSVSSPSSDETFLSHCVVLSFRRQTHRLDELWKKYQPQSTVNSKWIVLFTTTVHT